jgi:hypothetical protein
MEKYVLAVGCSYTDKDFKSNKVEHEYFPKWPELLGNKLNMPVVNLGKCGASNDWIEKTVIDRIINDGYNIDLIVIGFTETWRYAVYNKWLFNPLTHIDEEIVKRYNDQHGYDGDNLNIMKTLKVPFNRHMVTARFCNYDIRKRENLFRVVVNNYIDTIVRLQKLCAFWDIKLIATNLVDAFEPIFYKYATKITGNTWNIPMDEWCWAIENSPNFYEVDEETLIGWPNIKHLGGYSINHDILKEEDKISPEKGDWHPNRQGHELIAELYYEKYKEIYV